jgi:hypothetical protein
LHSAGDAGPVLADAIEQDDAIQVPPALKSAHDELHAELKRATDSGGRIGAAASAVARLMHPHFISEEELALPPLGLLSELSKGKLGAEVADVLKLTDNLEHELPRMLAEHKEIVATLQRLVEAANIEGKPDIAAFAAKLMAHARAEEEVSYPAAILIGRYLRSAFGPKADAGCLE